eukprot:scaffold268_cov210-Ochromonas_danica.AAC.31
MIEVNNVWAGRHVTIFSDYLEVERASYQQNMIVEAVLSDHSLPGMDSKVKPPEGGMVYCPIIPEIFVTAVAFLRFN